MTSYTPFEKPIRDLQISDLVVLKTVAEGWYVEYKGQLVSSSALAKAISAFANTYGGWLFLGIAELSKENPVAGFFPGVPNDEVDTTLQRLRQCAAEYLNPTPYFRTRTLRGPCSATGLAKDSTIIGLQIPQSHMAPHVHKDGRIYRRVADSSEPKPETDRFILDQLWRRGDRTRDYTRKWIKRDPKFSQSEDETPYVRLLLSVDPWFQRDVWLSASLPTVREIMMMDPVPFDTFYTTADGYIARQARNNNPHNYVMTWKIQRNLASEIIIPLPRYSSNRIETLVVDLDGYEHADRFVKILKDQDYQQPWIADMNHLMSLLVDFVAKYRRLLKLAEAAGEYYFKARILNVWRLLPFVDVESILDEYEEYGLPIVLDSEVMFPIGYGPDSFQLVEEKNVADGKGGEAVTSAIQAQLMFTWIALALGVPALVEAEDTGKAKVVSSTELLNAATRAMEVQRRRNIRNVRSG